LKGGVIGGSIVSGTFNIGDSVEIGPGRKIQGKKKVTYEPIKTTISSMQGGGNNLDAMHAGGLCGLATPLDPLLTASDNLSGQVLARSGELPPVREIIEIEINLLKEMVGGDDNTSDKVAPLRGGEMLMVNISTATSVGVVSNVGGGKATLNLRLPVVAEDGGRISLSRRAGTRWRLIGYGVIL
jgi:translation initiation factor 2 subunit 3